MDGACESDEGRRGKLTAWLEASDSAASFPGFQLGAPPDAAHLAIRAWNLMGGIDGALLPLVASIIGVEDIEVLMIQLCTIRDHQQRKAG